MSKLLFKKLYSDTIIPTKGSEYAAGYDIYSYKEYTIPGVRQSSSLANSVHISKELISTGFAMKVPEGCYGRFAPRSGLAWKNSIWVNAGVIDIDYEGECKVILENHGTEDFVIKKGDRIAQLILEKIVDNAEVSVVDELPKTIRGSGGFGSTG